MAELDLALRELGRHVEFPPTPDLASGVRRRLAERRRIWWQRPLVIALAVLGVAIGAVLAVPPARTAVLDWLGIRGARITRVEKLPPAPAVGNLDLGRRITLREARRRAPWLLVPSAERVGAPDLVSFSAAIPGGKITLLWGTRRDVHLLLTEFRGEAFIEKLVEPGAKVELLQVDGSRGAWVGGSHVLVYRDRNGLVREDTSRLAGKTLLWQRGEVTLRLEGDFSKQEALRIARSAR
ncbi:MAG TPA: hypothetical protein VF877_11295 [Gaiellaceae bacterium]